MSGPAKNINWKTVLLIAVIAVLFFSNSLVAEAAVKDSVKNAWASIKTFAFTGAFWVNTFIIFGAIFLGSKLFMEEKSSSDTFNKVVTIIIIALIALSVSSKIKDDAGKPMYIWDKDTFQKLIRFFIGPSGAEVRPPCTGLQEGSELKKIWGYEPNPPCCGTGAYWVTIKGQQQCRQAVLRTNDDGSGITAFILATLLFVLLFKKFGKELSLEGEKGLGKWLPMILSAFLAGLIANQRVRQNSIVIVGGWAAVIIIGNMFSKNFNESAKDDAAKQKKGFGFGLAFAFVELIANMLGASLIGIDMTSSDVSIGVIIRNVGLGIVFGFLFSFLSGGKGALGKIFSKMAKEREEQADKWVEDKNGFKAIGSLIPGLSGLFKHDGDSKKIKERKAKIKKKREELAEWMTKFEKEREKPARMARSDVLSVIISQIESLRKDIELLEEEAKETKDGKAKDE